MFYAICSFFVLKNVITHTASRYISHTVVRGNLVLRHTVPHFMSNVIILLILKSMIFLHHCLFHSREEMKVIWTGAEIEPKSNQNMYYTAGLGLES